MNLMGRWRRAGLVLAQWLWLFAGTAAVTAGVVTTVVIIKNNAAKAVQAVKNAEFTGGLFTSRTPSGSIEWQLLFTKRSGSSVFRVSGQFGDGSLSSNVTGQYDPASDRLVAGTFTASSETLGMGSPVPLIDVGGHWDSGKDCFVVVPNGLAQSVLPRDPLSPSPDQVIISDSLDVPSPQNSGDVLRGTYHLKLANVAKECSIKIELYLGDSKGPSAERDLYITEDDQYDVDLAQLLPATIPFNLPSTDMEVRVVVSGATDLSASPSQTIQVVGTPGDVHPVEVYSDSDAEYSPKPLTARVWLTYKLQSDRDTSVRIAQKATIEPIGDPTAVIPLPTHEFISAAAKTPLKVQDPGQNWDIQVPQAGEYVLRYEIGGDGVAVFHGSQIIDFPNASPPKDPKAPPTPKTKVQGGISLDKAVTKVNEPIQMTVTALNPDSDDDLDVTAVITLKDAKGRVVSSKSKPYKMVKGKEKKGVSNVMVSAPGDYTLELEITGEQVETFHSEAKFHVEGEPKPLYTGLIPPLTPAEEKAAFGLIEKTVGHAPGPQADPYGTWSGSVGESTISATYTSTRADYDSHASLQATWSTPPTSMKPGEVIDLTVTASASVTGKDHGVPSVDAIWGCSGGAFIESKNAFAGVSSSGAIIGSGSGHYKFKAPEDGEFTLYQAQSGISWGSGGVFRPCEYKYKRGSVAISGASPSSSPSPSESPGAGTDWGDGGIATGSIVQTSPDDPDDTAHIQAFIDPVDLTVFAGETSKIVNVHISGYRRNTLDRVEVIFPQKTDNWASLPGQIVVGGGNGSYDPANMGLPEHVDGYFFSARTTAPGGTFTVWIIVQQKGAGSVRIPLTVHVFGRPRPLGGSGPYSSPPPSTPPTSPTPTPPVVSNPPTDPTGFGGSWDTDMGRMVLTVDGANNVTGTFGTGGTLTGRVTGGKLTFRYRQDTDAGTGEMKLGGDGDSIEGSYVMPSPDGPTPIGFTGTRVK